MDMLQAIPLTLNLANAGAVAGTTNTFTTTAATVSVSKGKFVTAIGVLTNSATTPTTDYNTGSAFPAILPNTCATVVFGNVGGSLKAVQGTAVATETGVTTTVGNFINAPQFPAIPDGFVPFAYTVIRAAPSLTAGFTLGTTSWAASGASCTTFQNVCTLPDRPQIS